jgi:hypothetical protein
VTETETFCSPRSTTVATESALAAVVYIGKEEGVEVSSR